MVAIMTCFPGLSELKALKRLSGELTVQGTRDRAGRYSQLVLASERSEPLVLMTDYCDVVFKFECVGMSLKSLPAMSPEPECLMRFVGWDAIRCLFRFEWEGPARPGEVRAGWDPVTRRRGRWRQVSGEFTALAVSMVGIAFWNRVTDRAVSAVFNAPDDPVTLLAQAGPDAMDPVIADCDLVPLEELPVWIDRVQQWLDQIRESGSS